MPYNDKDSKDKISNEVSIKIRRNKRKFFVRSFTQIATLVLVTTTLSLVFLNILIRAEYNDLKKTIEENRVNKDNVIVDYTTIIDTVAPSIVSIGVNPDDLMHKTYVETNISGVIVSSDGLIITSNSKIKNVEEIYVKLPSSGLNPVKAKYLTGDDKLDIAAIKIDVDNIKLEPIKFVKSDYREGVAIAILSNSAGSDYIGKVVPGIITSLNNKINANGKEYNLIEVSAPIDMENTGGILCNSKGELLGIASFAVTQDINRSGAYYVVNIDDLGYMINSSELMKKKLGITGGVIIDNTNQKGFYIQSVEKHSSASAAGLKPTNIITTIDGNEIKSTEDLIGIIEKKQKGDTIKCNVIIDGKQNYITLEIVA